MWMDLTKKHTVCLHVYKIPGAVGRKVGSDCSWVWGFFVGEGRGVTKILWN